MIEGGFCVGKSEMPFTSICADHGIEQESRSMKVMGGIKGIGNARISLDDYFLSAQRWAISLYHSVADLVFPDL